MVQLQIQDNIYSWIENFFDVDEHYYTAHYIPEHAHLSPKGRPCMIQGSGLDPSSYT